MRVTEQAVYLGLYVIGVRYMYVPQQNVIVILDLLAWGVGVLDAKEVEVGGGADLDNKCNGCGGTVCLGSGSQVQLMLEGGYAHLIRSWAGDGVWVCLRFGKARCPLDFMHMQFVAMAKVEYVEERRGLNVGWHACHRLVA